MTSLQKLQEQLEKQIQNVEGKIERTNEIHHKLTHMSLTKADPNYKKSFSNDNTSKNNNRTICIIQNNQN